MKSLLQSRRTLLNLGAPGSAYSVAGCKLWIRADLGVNFASGSSIATVTEQSGRALVLSAASSTERPDLLGSLNGRPQINFDSGGAVGTLLLPAGTFTGLSDGHMFAVLRSRADSVGNESAGIWALGGATSASQGDLYPFSDGGIYLGIGSNARRRVAISSAHAAATRQPHILEVVSTSTEYRVRNATVQYTDLSANTPAWSSAPKIGVNLNSVKWRGALAELLVFDHKLSNADAATVRNALRSRFGFVGAYSNALAPAPVNASTVAGCVTWLDPLNVITDGSGGVGTATDSAGGLGNYTQATAARRPTITSATDEGINGARAFKFTRASSQYLVGPAYSGLTSAEAFFVVQPVAGITNHFWRYGSYGGPTWWPNVDTYGYSAFGTASLQATGGPVPNAGHVVNVIVTPTEFTINLDGVLSSTTTGHTQGWNALGVLLGASGASGITPQNYFDGLLGVFAVFDHKLSSADRSTIHLGLRDRFGTA